MLEIIVHIRNRDADNVPGPLRVLVLAPDKRCQEIDKQPALVERCNVWRRGRERVSGSVSLTYGAVVLTAGS